MKLTNYLRDAFIKAALDDVPSVDYTSQGEKLLLDAVIAKLPPKVRAVWDDVALRGLLETESCWLHEFRVRAPMAKAFRPDAKLDDKLKELAAARDSQAEKRRALESKLRAAAYGCSTRKGLAELLPEFERYLPPEEGPASRTLPVVANLVADFVAAGWPKSKPPQKVVPMKQRGAA